MHRLQEFLQAGAVQLQLRGVQFVERIAEVHHHQVALVAQHGVHRALPSLFGRLQRSRRLARDLRLTRRAQLAPLRPAEAEHLMQHAQPFQSQRHTRQFGGYSWYLSVAQGHSKTP